MRGHQPNRQTVSSSSPATSAAASSWAVAGQDHSVPAEHWRHSITTHLSYGARSSRRFTRDRAPGYSSASTTRLWRLFQVSGKSLRFHGGRTNQHGVTSARDQSCGYGRNRNRCAALRYRNVRIGQGALPRRAIDGLRLLTDVYRIAHSQNVSTPPILSATPIRSGIGARYRYPKESQ